MNFLAHQFLSNDNPALKAGNFLADFVRGKESINQLPLPVQQGVYLHRFIDQYTDTHPAIKNLKQIMSKDFGRYASVVIDILFDHCLAINWVHFNPISLADFATITYDELNQFIPYFDTTTLKAYQSMKTNNWLLHYSLIEGLEKAIQNIATRAHFENNLKQAPNYYILHKEQIDQIFLEFFPAIQQATKEFIHKNDYL